MHAWRDIHSTQVNSAEQANERCGDAGKPRGKQTAEKTTRKVSWVTRQLPPCSSRAGCVPMADLEDLLYARVECSLAKSVGCTDSAIGIQHQLSGRREHEAMSWDDAILSTCGVMRGVRHDMAGDFFFHISRV